MQPLSDKSLEVLDITFSAVNTGFLFWCWISKAAASIMHLKRPCANLPPPQYLLGGGAKNELSSQWLMPGDKMQLCSKYGGREKFMTQPFIENQ